MNLLFELVQDYHVLDNDQNTDEVPTDEVQPDELAGEDDLPSEDPNDPLDQVADDTLADDAGDPDKQGLIRTVKNAHLVYKRKQEDGTFEELWVYSASDMRSEQTIRQAILSGTDIPVDGSSSEDGQLYSIWSAGNAEVMQITGLPS